MTLRWDLLLPTKTTLIRQRDPTIADAGYDYAVIWVNKLTNSAWLLKDSTMQVLPPTTGTVIDIASEDALSLTELDARMDNLEADMDEYVATVLDDVITSSPNAGEYKIADLRLDSGKQIVVKYDEDAE